MSTSSNDPRATIAIFTHEQGPLANLDEVAPLQSPMVDVLLVDASQSPERVADNQRRAQALGFTYLPTPGAGLAAQRNRAGLATRADVIVFLDDDCFPRDGWLKTLMAALESGADVATARVVRPAQAPESPYERFFDQDRGATPRAFTRKDLRVLPPLAAILRPYAREAGMAPWVVGTGSSFAVRWQTFRNLGGFRKTLGVGTRARSGEDTDFFLRALAAGATIRYEADAVVEHRHVRRDAGDYLRTAHAYGVGGREVLRRNLNVKPGYAFILAARPAQLLLLALKHRVAGDAATSAMCLSALRGWLGLRPPQPAAAAPPARAGLASG